MKMKNYQILEEISKMRIISRILSIFLVTISPSLKNLNTKQLREPTQKYNRRNNLAREWKMKRPN